MNNNCTYLKIKINRTLECKKQKKIINIRECSRCNFRKDKISNNHQIKKRTYKQSKRTKALAISKQVKLIVWERDNHKCIFCECEVPWNLANSHFIKRSHGGLGIPENVFCACFECHNQFDNSINRKRMFPVAKHYLMSKYNDWNEDKLIYKK